MTDYYYYSKLHMTYKGGYPVEVAEQSVKLLSLRLDVFNSHTTH